MIQRVCELFMNNILYFCEQLEISIWQHCALVFWCHYNIPLEVVAELYAFQCIPMGSCTRFHWEVVAHTSHLTTETTFDLRCESVTYLYIPTYLTLYVLLFELKV